MLPKWDLRRQNVVTLLKKLEKYISSSPLCVVSLDESMKSVLQNEQMDVAIRFWNNSKIQGETRYMTISS